MWLLFGRFWRQIWQPFIPSSGHTGTQVSFIRQLSELCPAQAVRAGQLGDGQLDGGDLQGQSQSERRFPVDPDAKDQC